MFLPDFWAKFLDFRSTLQITLGHVESNNDVQLSFISQVEPWKKEGYKLWGGANCTVYVHSSSQSQLSAYGFLHNAYSVPTQLSLGSRGIPWVVVHYNNLLVWKIHGICCQETQWSSLGYAA